jgi:O-antigen ligase
LFGILQSAFLPKIAQMIYHDSRSFNWDEQGRRLVSTVLEPNIAGTMLMIGVLVQVARITVGASVRWWRFLVLFTGLTLTISRSAAVGMFFGMIVIVATQGLSRRFLKAMAVVGVLAALASPFLIRYLLAFNKFSLGEGSSAAERLNVWLQAIRVVSDYPLFGVGFNTYRYALEHYGVRIVGASSYAAEGGLLFIAALTGFVGLAVYCAMCWQVVARSRSIWRDATVPASHRGLAIGTTAATVGVVFASTFVNALLATFIMEILWVLWALTFVIARAQSARSAKTQGLPSPQIVALAA